MKGYLLIILLALAYCETFEITQDKTKIVTCVLKSDIFFNAVAAIVDAIQKKDFWRIGGILIDLGIPIVNEIKKCNDA